MLPVFLRLRVNTNTVTNACSTTEPNVGHMLYNYEYTCRQDHQFYVENLFHDILSLLFLFFKS